MTSQQIVPQTVDFSTERSTSLRFASHADGITTLGFRSQKTGAPTSDYDYPDPTGEHFAALTAAERPGTYFRRALKAGEFPAHIDKRPAVVAPVQSAIIIEMPGVEGSVAQVVKAEPASIEKVEKEALSLFQQVRALRITDHDTYAKAVDMARAVKAMQADVMTAHAESIAAADKAHKAALALRNKTLVPLKEAEEYLKIGIGQWAEDEKKRREAEARKAQEEAARLQREAEARQRAEYERQMEEARKAAEAERLEREAQIEAALEEAEANGASAIEVEAIMAQAAEEPPAPVFVPLPPVQIIVPRVPVVQAPKVAGVSVPTTVVGVIENKAELLAYIAANVDQYEALVEIKQGALDRLGKATDGRIKLPGVRWDKRASVSIRK